ncbi:hypothetical protein D082_17770 [Synechocystis sp. PCC 6714]|nr:hypothetical protein D082_17770 [Synechocystis sp. PCC 6714]
MVILSTKKSLPSILATAYWEAKEQPRASPWYNCLAKDGRYQQLNSLAVTKFLTF